MPQSAACGAAREVEHVIASCTIHTSVTVQASLSNLTDAFKVTQAVSGTTIALSNDVLAPTCPGGNQEQLSADWSQCGNDIANGTACAYFQLPCPVSLECSIADPYIACPDNLASQPPFSEPPYNYATSTQLNVQLTRDDGSTKALSYPPPHGGELTLSVTQGTESCEVDYDGMSAPRIQASAGAGCTNTACEVELSYMEPCLQGAGPVNGTCSGLEVVIVVCLQAQLACPNATASPFQGATPSSLACTPQSADLRQLSCGSAEYQQRTLWAAALLSRSPAGESAIF